jgi:hypothetical protein
MTQRFALQEGERDRRIEVTLAPVPAPPAPPRSSELPRRAPPDRERPVPGLTYAFGGLGVAAALVGAAFQISGMGKRSDLFACRPACGQDQVDSAERTLWVGNILLGVGVVSLAVATWLYVTRPTAPLRTAWH